MPLDFNEESFEPDPTILLVNGCIPLRPEQCVPHHKEKSIALNLDQINLPEDDQFWRDSIMTTVKSSIAKTLLQATSIQFRGQFYKASQSA